MSAVTVASLRDIAQTQIANWGSSITLKKPPTQSGYDFATGTTIPGVPNDIAIKGVISNASTNERDGLLTIDDILVMVDHTQTYSIEEDKIVISDTSYNIISIMPEMHADIVVYQNLLLRA